MNSVNAQVASSDSEALLQKYDSYIVIAGVCQVKGKTSDGRHTLTVCTQAVYDAKAKNPVVEYIHKPLLRTTQSMSQVLSELERHKVQLDTQHSIPPFRLITASEFLNFMLSLENADYAKDPAAILAKLASVENKNLFVKDLLRFAKQMIQNTEAEIAQFQQSIYDNQEYKCFMNQIALEPQDPQAISKAWDAFLVFYGLAQASGDISGTDLKKFIQPLRRLETSEEKLFFMRELLSSSGDPYFKQETDPVSSNELQIRMLQQLQKDQELFFGSLAIQWNNSLQQSLTAEK